MHDDEIHDMLDHELISSMGRQATHIYIAVFTVG